MPKQTQEYASYNVLARKPLIAGVPIITLLVFLCLMLVTGFGGIILLGVGAGLVFPTILAFALFCVRIACMDDSRAMDGVWWNVKGALTRVQCNSLITSFTSTDHSAIRRKQHVRDWFKNNSNR
ncbi:MAG: hypothetical protein ACRCWR_01520 [Saezia sp.]